MNFQPTKRKQAIEDLPIKVYIEGTCFLCSKECESYVHDYCAIAYTDHKDKKVKEIEEKYNGWKSN